MKLERKQKTYQKIAVFVAINMLIQIAFPTAAFALTSGPSSPEFSSYEPVATTDMVNEFTGDLTYNLPVVNIPGANGEGYAMSLSYHSGATPEEEASWVGYGFTLNPGAINRNKRGFADDWKEQDVTYYNETRPNETVSVGGNLGELEIFNADILGVSIGPNATIRYNNYKGFGYTAGIGLKLGNGVVSLGFSVTDGEGSFSLTVNPAALLSSDGEKGKENAKQDEEKVKDQDAKPDEESAEPTAEEIAAADKKKKDRKNNIKFLGGIASNYGLRTFAGVERPTQITDYTGFTASVALASEKNPLPLPVGLASNLRGGYTRQENTAVDNLTTYGYMYSSHATEDDMMDYYIEKGSTYNKRDKFLGIPFNNADSYTLTGEALGGGFRMYNRKAGQYHPNYKKSTTKIINIGPEASLGTDFGLSGDIGVGSHTLKVEKWMSLNRNGFAQEELEDEANFFRFNNDLGGFVTFGSEAKQQADVVLTRTLAGIKKADARINHITTALDASERGSTRSLRSSYIGYNTNKNIDTLNGAANIRYKAYNKDEDILDFNTSYRDSFPDQIGEFSVVNEGGSRYTYGLPVLSKKEKNIQIDLLGVKADKIDSNFLVYKDNTYTQTRVGEVRNTPYATTYLLTSIETPDYIDRTNDGPSDDDFGGVTSFEYTRLYGGTSGNWYKWRMPYAGLSYNKNELSNPYDDLGSVAEGEKEIYYLKKVETTTHYAIFYTSNRKDGFDAEHDASTASNIPSAQGNNALKKLDKIKLFAKSSTGPDELIKTVHFKYKYLLNQGVLNNDGTGGAENEGGKLTLEKVWFEYEGVVNANISPYQFGYEYTQSTNAALPNYADYPAKYDDFENYGSGKNENPDYSPYNLDAWGNYQYGGAARFMKMKTWLDQSGTYDAVFDPAAWQLKVIKLPSGGEIHVQYEQDDYLYVQDQEAHAMVSLLPGGGSDPEDDHKSGLFYLNTADLGVTTHSEKQRLATLIRTRYQTGGKKIYFKMLYKLLGSSVPDLTGCNVEYITGYAKVTDVRYNKSQGKIVVRLKNEEKQLPFQVCKDYVKTQKAGMLTSVGSNCDPSDKGVKGNTMVSKVTATIGAAANWLRTFVPGQKCRKISYTNSYLRIPTLYDKRGGGIRVKRLLMYDKGMDTNTPVLYGSEYIYKAFDRNRGRFMSSGVATNEPSSIREENILVDFIKLFKQDFIDKVVAGRDKKNAEGPLGESILPGPSVGYSQIITRSIHSGKTNPGYAINKFFTAFDYPFISDKTEMDRDTKDRVPAFAGLVNVNIDNQWLSQGFVFKLNNMHGQKESSATYAGEYADILSKEDFTQKAIEISSEEFTYFKQGEELPILNTKDLSYGTTLPLGKEMEVVFESRAVKDIANDGALEAGGDLGVLGVLALPYISAVPFYTYSEAKLYTHATTKIINYPAVVKSVKSSADGISHLLENIAFNPDNGQPILTRTTDGFDGLDLLASTGHDGTYWNYTYPASLEYDNAGQKAINETKVLVSGSVSMNKSVSSGQVFIDFTGPSGEICGGMGDLIAGDLIEVRTAGGTSDGFFHIGDFDPAGSQIEIFPTYYSTDGGTVNNATIEVIRSGRTNQLSSNVGSITTYGETEIDTTQSDYIELLARQIFVEALNSTLDSVRAGQLPDTTLLSTEKVPKFLEFNHPISEHGCVNYGYNDPPGASYAIILYKDSLWIGDAYCSVSLATPGSFELDPNTGQVVYDSGNNTYCSEASCLSFCGDIYTRNTLTNVVASEASTLSDVWDYDSTRYYPLYTDRNNYEMGKKGKWRTKDTYAYEKSVTTGKNYNSGMYALDLFNWQNESSNSANWLKLNTVTQYSPNGNALEEQNILGIKSAAKFGYSKTLPYLVAQNTDYNSVLFESFENSYLSDGDTLVEDGVEIFASDGTRVTTTQHSGKQSYKLNFSESQGVDFSEMTVTQQILDNGMLYKVWVKTDNADRSALGKYLTAGISDETYTVGSFYYQTMTKVAQVGEWYLYEATIPASQFSADFSLNDVFKLFIKYEQQGSENVWIDDVRIQPADAQMTTYVYDVNTHRLVTTFDDQHFGLFYQYNGEGKLVRKLIETERGMKTVQETQYNTPKLIDNPIIY